MLYSMHFISYNINMKKYNWQTIGHNKIVKILQKSIESNKLAHAYLFSGKEGLGKRFLAEKFINSILCHDYNLQNKQEVKSLPCNDCVFCNQLNKKIHPDVYFLKKEEDKKNISVEQVREMQKVLHMASFLNSYKIALIDSADDLSESAQNALLKILEEPKSKTILLLISSDYKGLLPTIVSRCQIIRFLPLANETIFKHLLELGASREQANLLAALSHGQIGGAINFYKNQDFLNEYIENTKQFLALFNNNISNQFKILDNLLVGFKNNFEINNQLNKELDYWQLVLRDILAMQYNLDNLVINLYFKDKLADLAKKYKSWQIIELLAKIKAVKQYLKYNINPRLAVENLVLNF
ncbi:MAG: DNA polymerase III subunit delta' [Candidatus Buchananbacteria bacterium]|nr:DNA polymerase III subunit delta' [Candidatus Buchananbacteria bacterium]